MFSVAVSAAGDIVMLNQVYSGLLEGMKKQLCRERPRICVKATIEGTIETIWSKVHKVKCLWG